jgi:hypothetical protein
MDTGGLLVRTCDVIRKINLGEWSWNIAIVDQMCFCVLFDLQGAVTLTRPAWMGLMNANDLLVRPYDVLRKLNLGEWSWNIAIVDQCFVVVYFLLSLALGFGDDRRRTLAVSRGT